jgi:uncharacterized repeat protein (TIGR01451 family)
VQPARSPLPSRTMIRTTRILGAISLALLTALLAVAAPARAGAALSGLSLAITNIATIEWGEGDGRVSQSSNRVDIAVAAAAKKPSLTSYRFSHDPGGLSLSLAAPRCESGGAAPLAPAFQEVSLAPARLALVRAIAPGDAYVFAIDQAAANRDPSRVETLTAAILSQNGDRETLTVFETEADSGRFAGYVQTAPASTAAVRGDCRLTVSGGDRILVEIAGQATSAVDVLADPLGIVFDSDSGAPVSGVRITLVDAASGQPATVFADDGASAYPSTLVTGETGGYRFPLVRPGTYRIQVEAPAPYRAPSARSAADMAGLIRPDGEGFALAPASFGGTVTVVDTTALRVDVPVDKPGDPLLLSLTESRASADPGDAIQYRIELSNSDPARATGTVTLTDLLPAALRLRAGSVQIETPAAAPQSGLRAAMTTMQTGTATGGSAPQVTIRSDGFTVVVPPLAPGARLVLSFLVEVRAEAGEGDAVSRIEAVDDRGNRSTADAVVRIRRETLAGRMTIVGRIAEGGCTSDGKGVAGVRVMLEDGSYAVTDADGRYHLEGVEPGTHVVQLDDMTLPLDRAPADCARDTRSAGRSFSRFVEGAGGALKRVDFRVAQVAPRAERRGAPAERATPPSDAAAAGAERDWLAGQEPGMGWIFPEPEHNPRAPIVRVAIKHLPGQTVKLFSDGRPVDPIAYEGLRKNGAGTVAVSLWRGIPVEAGVTHLTAEVRNADGSLAETLRRDVRYGAGPIHAELLRERSLLSADGVSRPVLAVRFTDRDGRPVRHGMVGEFEVPAPYYPAVEADAQQARQLAGLERARPFWRVQGEDGVALIELEPTTASGSVSLRFAFKEGETTREQRLEAWLDPGDRPWTIVGLAEGTVGYNNLDRRLEALGGEEDKVLTDGRLALYAKGRVRGKWLMTLAYDSARKEGEARFGGVIDPQAYYTVYADRSERRYDAASVRRLYLKLERPQFYALFGDYETGIDEPELARYVRAFNGVKAEYRSDRVAATAFAADTPNRHRRDEIQGNGLTGPYPLGARDILANSERVTIEVRDRLRSDRIVERRLLSRHIDYDIDYALGTLRFREPILSRSSSLDPQFIVAEYEVEGVASRALNAGGRVALRNNSETLQVAATAIRDSDGETRTTLAGADLRYRPSASTELRAEVAVSDSRADAGPAAGTATAWQVEAEHHGGRYDLLAYARERQTGFGLGQTSGAESGTRKFGFDARARFGESWSLVGSAWHETYLATDARRMAARALLEYRSRDMSARAGFTFADDSLADGRSARSTLLQLGATRRLFDNKLELDAQTEIPIGGSADSIDFPAKHRLAARYAVTRDVQLVGAYEIADGEHVDARTARLGFDLSPWAGARIAVSGNVQDIAEYGPRSFAAFGLSQSLVLDEHWSVDATLDANKTLGGIDPARVINPLHPVASGGFLGSAGTLTEDFSALTAGATYRAGEWSVTGRAEYRNGEHEDRYGFTGAALRQIGEGSAIGGSVSWLAARAEGGAETRTSHLQLSWAHRPAGSAWSWLEKLELREDRVTGAVAGEAAPLRTPLTIVGDARSRRAVNSLSVNFSPQGALEGTEASIFWGSRYVAERLGADDIKGLSNVVGADLRFDIAPKIDIGFAGTVRHGVGARAIAWSGGPSLGITPFENGWLSVGWNIVGFHDRDFEEARYTRSGPYVMMRFKFDQLTLQSLGLGSRR